MSWMGRGRYARDLKIGHGFGEMEGEASAEYTTASLRRPDKKYALCQTTSVIRLGRTI